MRSMAGCRAALVAAGALLGAMLGVGCGRSGREQKADVKPNAKVTTAPVKTEQAVAGARLTAKQVAELDAAFAELQDVSLVDVRRTAKTDRGYARLKKVGASNAAERAYIAEKLPALIAAGPHSARPDSDDPRWRTSWIWRTI